MKAKVLLPILSMALLFGCKSFRQAASPPCPPGTKAMGQAPPAGDETWCEKIVDGKPVKDGPFVVYRESGFKMLEGYYTDGKQSGAWTMWYDNGQKKSIDHYKNGIQTGRHESWYSNGKLDAIGQYKDGQPDGVWKRWDPQGFRNWEEVYKDGKRVS
jgi:MORN repeat variant